MSTGRNFDEVLRVIDSMQLTAKHKVATPANWRDGEEVIILPAVSDADAKEKYPRGLARSEAVSSVRASAETVICRSSGRSVVRSSGRPVVRSFGRSFGVQPTRPVAR